MPERRLGRPKTEEERRATHQAIYGTTELPPRGSGLSSNPGNPNNLTESQKKPEYSKVEFVKRLWDNIKNRFVYGWRSDVRVIDFHRFFDAKKLTTTSAYTSEGFRCEPYSRMLVLFQIPDTTGAPTDLLVELEFSYDGVTWFKYMRDAWGDMRWEDTGAPYNECFDAPVLAPYVRFKATSQGASASAYFTLTLDAIFISGA